jgi:hypothetical protein
VNVRLVGLTVTAVPVPVNGIVWGVPGALSLTERFAVREPVAVGRKVTLMLQFAPAARVAPQVVVLAKSAAFVPVKPMVVMLMLEFPVFDRVTARALLVVFNNCTPKASEVGDSCAAGLVPVPLNGTV